MIKKIQSFKQKRTRQNQYIFSLETLIKKKKNNKIKTPPSKKKKRGGKNDQDILTPV